MSAPAAFLARHWRTLLGAALGAIAGAAYAHFVGCRTGTCAITSNVWTAAAFFGFTGAVAGAPGQPRERREGSGRAGPPAAGQRSSPSR